MKVNIGPYPLGNLPKSRKVKIEFHPHDFWALDHTLALIILPSLQAFRKNPSYPACFESNEPWLEILDKMIYAFEHIVNEDDYYLCNKTMDKKIQQGLNLFSKWYQ